MLCPGRFTSGKDPVPIVYEAAWAPLPAWTSAETSPKPGLNPRTVQLVASRYTDCAIPGHARVLYVIHILRLRVCEKRALKRIFGPKRVEVTGACGRLHNKEMNDV